MSAEVKKVLQISAAVGLNDVIKHSLDFLDRAYPDRPRRGWKTPFTKNPYLEPYKMIRAPYVEEDGTSAEVFIEQTRSDMKIARGIDTFKRYILISLTNSFSRWRSDVLVQNGYGTKHQASDEEITEYKTFMTELRDKGVQFKKDESAGHEFNPTLFRG